MTATQVALSELTALRELSAALMFEHCSFHPHHSDLCPTCKSAYALGIKPDPGPSADGLMVDIQRKENANGDGYFGVFDGKGRRG